MAHLKMLSSTYECIHGAGSDKIKWMPSHMLKAELTCMSVAGYQHHQFWCSLKLQISVWTYFGAMTVHLLGSVANSQVW